MPGTNVHPLSQLLNGTIDSFANDRPRLERSLERFFFKWNPFATMGPDERQTIEPRKFQELDPTIGSLFEKVWYMDTPKMVLEVIVCDDTNLHLLHAYRDLEARLPGHSAHLLSRHAVDLMEIAATHQSITAPVSAPEQAWIAKAGLFSLWPTTIREDSRTGEERERPSMRVEIRHFQIIDPGTKETRTVYYWKVSSVSV